MARRLLSGLATVSLTTTILGAAATLELPLLRSLDAILLAAAQRAGTELRVLLTYDTRMSDAAKSLANPVVAPS